MKEQPDRPQMKKDASATTQQPQGQQTQPSAAQPSERQSSPAVPQAEEQQGQPRGTMRRDWFTPSSWAENPFAMMRRLSDEMERFFEDFGFGRGWLGSHLGHGREFGQNRWSPQIEVSERDNQLTVCADLPGLKKEDIQIEFSDGALTIQGERRQEHEETREGYQRSERSYGKFYRSIPLPEGVNPENAKATFQDGVLKIVMPIPPHEGPRSRRIEIQDSHDQQSRGQSTLSEQTPVQQSSA